MVAFLRRAVAFYGSHGVTVEGLMTDNGPAYRSTAIHSPAAAALSAGSSATTSGDDTAPSATARPQLGSLSWNNVMGNYS